MKKYLFLFIFSLFLVIPIGASAANKNVRIDFDSHEKFNYFYEQKNNTPFYQFLVGQGSDLPITLNDYTSNSYEFGGGNLRIYYSWELSLDFMPENAKYIIVVDTISGTASINYDGKNLSISSYFSNSNHPFCFGLDNIIFYFFDSSATYLGSSIRDYATSFEDKTSGCDLILNNTYDISKNANPDFTYFLSKYYMFHSSLNWTNNTDIIVSDLLLDGEVYLIDNNENYSAFWATLRKIFSFGDVKDYDVSETSLQYFKENIVYGKDNSINCLYEMVVKYDSIESPFDDNYLAVDLYTSDASSYYFVPKTNDSSFDYNLYAYTSYDNVEINSLVYDISTDNPSLLNDFLFVCPIKNKYIKLGFNSLLLNDGTTQFKMDSNYMYYITTNTNKYPVWIYYNKNVYDVYRSDFENVTNVNTGNIIKFSSSTGRFDYNFILGKLEQETTNAKIDNFFGFDLTDSNIFKEIMNFITGFVATISSIFTCVFLVFDSLPKELQMLFYFMLFSGIIIIIYNLIRGR